MAAKHTDFQKISRNNAWLDADAVPIFLDIKAHLDYSTIFDFGEEPSRQAEAARAFILLRGKHAGIHFRKLGTHPMGLTEQLAQEKDAIVKKWFDRVVDTYPAETARFLRSQSDPFANPVGQTTFQGLGTAFELLAGTMDADKARNALDPIIRIRAIQDFTASRAVRFVFELKEIVRSAVSRGADLTALESRIDELALVAFDLYMSCREKIYDLKANEMKSRTYKAFAKAGLIKELDDE